MGSVPGGESKGFPSLGCGVDVLVKTTDSSLVGFVQDIRTNALSITIKQPLVEGSAVSIEFGSECRDGEIVSCRRHGSRYEACVVVPNKKESDLRLAERFPITLEVVICSDSLESQMDAVVVDMSAQGMGLETSVALKTGEIVTVESSSNIAFGIVRYCSALPGGPFRAGVEVFHVMLKETEDAANASVVDRLFSFH